MLSFCASKFPAKNVHSWNNSELSDDPCLLFPDHCYSRTLPLLIRPCHRVYTETNKYIEHWYLYLFCPPTTLCGKLNIPNVYHLLFSYLASALKTHPSRHLFRGYTSPTCLIRKMTPLG